MNDKQHSYIVLVTHVGRSGNQPSKTNAAVLRCLTDFNRMKQKPPPVMNTDTLYNTIMHSTTYAKILMGR